MSGKTRLFTLEWDNSKLPIKNHEDRYGKKQAEGVHFYSDLAIHPGVVCLDTGAVYDTMTELKEHLDRQGKYTLTYQDEPNEQEGQDRGVA